MCRACGGTEQAICVWLNPEIVISNFQSKILFISFKIKKSKSTSESKSFYFLIFSSFNLFIFKLTSNTNPLITQRNFFKNSFSRMYFNTEGGQSTKRVSHCRRKKGSLGAREKRSATKFLPFPIAVFGYFWRKKKSCFSAEPLEIFSLKIGSGSLGEPINA